MFSIALTGSIGTGKSTIAKLFKELGATVLCADAINRQLITTDGPTLNKIVTHFGQSIINPQGQLDRSALKERIFNSPKDKEWLEKLLHPLIRQQIQENINKSTGPYCLVEIPLLTSIDPYPFINRVLLCQSTNSLQIDRVKKRDGSDEDLIQTIINSQPNDALRKSIADDMLLNDGTLEELHHKVKTLHVDYCKRSFTHNLCG